MSLKTSEAVADSLFSWVDTAGQTQVLDVDVVMSADDEREVKLTDHTVEDGSVITDHVVILPERVSFELLVTQTPMGGPGMALAPVEVSATTQALSAKTYPLNVRQSEFRPGGFLLLTQGARAVVSSAVNFVLGGGPGAATFAGSELIPQRQALKAQTLQAATPTDHVNDVHDKLIEIMQNALRVTISFKGRLHVDYLLTKVKLKHGAGEFGLGRFSVDARAFNTVTGVAVQLPDPEDFRAKPSSKKGNKPAKGPDPDPTKATMRSITKHGVEGDLGKFVQTGARGLLGY